MWFWRSTMWQYIWFWGKNNISAPTHRDCMVSYRNLRCDVCVTDTRQSDWTPKVLGLWLALPGFNKCWLQLGSPFLKHLKATSLIVQKPHFSWWTSWTPKAKPGKSGALSRMARRNLLESSFRHMALRVLKGTEPEDLKKFYEAGCIGPTMGYPLVIKHATSVGTMAMVYLREIIPFYGWTIQVSESLWFTPDDMGI